MSSLVTTVDSVWPPFWSPLKVIDSAAFKGSQSVLVHILAQLFQKKQNKMTCRIINDFFIAYSAS